MRHAPTICLITLFTALLVVTAPAFADTARTMGADGTSFRVLDGTYGELFPNGVEDAGSHAVLALEVRHPDGESELRPVPATLGPADDISPILVVENASNTVFLLWESWSGPTQSRYLITSFSSTGWTEPIEIIGAPFVWRTGAQLAVTYDTFACLPARNCEQGVSEIGRTIIHLVWQQESEGGTTDVVYAPLVFENGTYVGEHPRVFLKELLPPQDQGGPLVDARFKPSIRSGLDSNSVIVGFQDGGGSRMASVEIRVLPGELSDIGSVLQEDLEESLRERGLGDEEDLQYLIDRTRHQLIDVGARLKPEILDRLVADTTAFLAENAGDGAEVASIAGRTRHQLIDVGARLSEGHIMQVNGRTRHQLIDVGVRGRPVGGPGPGPAVEYRHDLQVTNVQTVPLPETLPATGLDLFLGPSGNNFLLAWGDEEVISYREFFSDAWSETRSLRLTDEMDRENALFILEQRVDRSR